MKVDNYRKSIPFKIYFIVTLVIFISLSVYTAFNKGADYFYVYLGLSIIFGIIYLFMWLRKPNYFYFEILHSSIVIRYFNPHPFFSKPKAFSISLTSLIGYEIKQRLKGFNKSIIFEIKKAGKKGKYPPISISLLSASEINEMKKELDIILKIRSLK